MISTILSLLQQFPLGDIDQSRSFGLMPFLVSHKAGQLVAEDSGRRDAQINLCSYLALVRWTPNRAIAAAAVNRYAGSPLHQPLMDPEEVRKAALLLLQHPEEAGEFPAVFTPEIQRLAKHILDVFGNRLQGYPPSFLSHMEDFLGLPSINPGIEMVRTLILAERQSLPLLELKPFCHLEPGEAIISMVTMAELVSRQMSLPEREVRRQMAYAELYGSLVFRNQATFRLVAGMIPAGPHIEDGIEWQRSPADLAVGWLMPYL